MPLPRVNDASFRERIGATAYRAIILYRSKRIEKCVKPESRGSQFGKGCPRCDWITAHFIRPLRHSDWVAGNPIHASVFKTRFGYQFIYLENSTRLTPDTHHSQTRIQNSSTHTTSRKPCPRYAYHLVMIVKLRDTCPGQQNGRRNDLQPRERHCRWTQTWKCERHTFTGSVSEG